MKPDFEKIQRIIEAHERDLGPQKELRLLLEYAQELENTLDKAADMFIGVVSGDATD